MEMVRILAVFGGVRKSKHNVVELHTAHSIFAVFEERPRSYPWDPRLPENQMTELRVQSNTA